VVIGFVSAGMFFSGTFFEGVIFVDGSQASGDEQAREMWLSFGDVNARPWYMALHGFATAPFWLAVAGVALAWFFYLKRPDIPAAIARRFAAVHRCWRTKYYRPIQRGGLRRGARLLGRGPWQGATWLIDGLAVNGRPNCRLDAAVIRRLQSGYIYHYASRC